MNRAKIWHRVRGRAQNRAWKSFEQGKRAFQSLAGPSPAGHVFIFGCQRSGTTHAERLFRADPRSAVFGEFSALSVDLSTLVWRPLPEVRRHLESQRARFTVARSLYASHAAGEVLSTIPHSTGIFLFRDVDGVIRSMLSKWGTTAREVFERVETVDGVWELSELWERIEQEAARLTPGDDPLQRARDAYALYWCARNEAFFQQACDRLMLVNYAEMIAAPESLVSSALAKLGLEAPRFRFPIRTRHAPGVQPLVQLSPDVRLRCQALYDRLNASRTVLT